MLITHNKFVTHNKLITRNNHHPLTTPLQGCATVGLAKANSYPWVKPWASSLPSPWASQARSWRWERSILVVFLWLARPGVQALGRSRLRLRSIRRCTIWRQRMGTLCCLRRGRTLGMWDRLFCMVVGLYIILLFVIL